jgi:hypothetical protein
MQNVTLTQSDWAVVRVALMCWSTRKREEGQAPKADRLLSVLEKIKAQTLMTRLCWCGMPAGAHCHSGSEPR